MMFNLHLRETFLMYIESSYIFSIFILAPNYKLYNSRLYPHGFITIRPRSKE